MPKYFTLEEATALLPTIRPILEQIITLRARLERTERDLVSLHWKARTNGHADYSELANLLIDAGHKLTLLQEDELNLETAFMALTKGITS